MFRLVLLFISAVATTSYGANINVSSRIMGGENVMIENYPYQISLEDEIMHRCGGSLIRPNVVLTAAHCIHDASYWVRAGSTISEEGGQVVQVTDVCSHFKFNRVTYDYDVAVLKLNTPLNLNSAVQLINLQNVGETVWPNTMATVTGWGYLKTGGSSSKILQKIEVPKVDDRTCQEIYYYNPIKYTDRMTCYGYINGEKDSCEGDSGGPLVANGKQIGIAAWGSECENPSKPGVYTRLDNEEINYHINSCLAKFANGWM